MRSQNFLEPEDFAIGAPDFLPSFLPNAREGVLSTLVSLPNLVRTLSRSPGPTRRDLSAALRALAAEVVLNGATSQHEQPEIRTLNSNATVVRLTLPGNTCVAHSPGLACAPMPALKATAVLRAACGPDVQIETEIRRPEPEWTRCSTRSRSRS